MEISDMGTTGFVHFLPITRLDHHELRVELHPKEHLAAPCFQHFLQNWLGLQKVWLRAQKGNQLILLLSYKKMCSINLSNQN